MVPKMGIEPIRTQGPPDFESGASASSATSAFLKFKNILSYFIGYNKGHWLNLMGKMNGKILIAILLEKYFRENTKLSPLPLVYLILLCYNLKHRADIAQLVERKLPKLEAAGSKPVVRSIFMPFWHTFVCSPSTRVPIN